MFGLVNELFNPGAQHAEDEKQRLEHTRYEEGCADPASGPVDLDSGQILITLPGQEAVLPPRVRLVDEDGLPVDDAEASGDDPR
ncbi:DUF6191 domain-containing protein [Streptomyces alkaliterrae]|uniref:Uncharacterized protein n=1 Tax=Streptomyces alkaliterrae TaxID=2213162 RepID=A0A5P0YX25_9ACTN|nr:DUF6191 domain-containing protein [Streptomyces alkaliterrae]MBB1256361.1 hypothetical protein [Streptomyces alkaliterrae]MBB1260871.1 hypothetical protein [Streptomyces alkaliterrae]MQS04841.1 hypothetical protein [Streptomyces alkaliterrae]